MNKQSKKMWALYVALGVNQGYQDKKTQKPFEDDMWDFVVDEASKAGMNTILLQLDDAVEFGSHPEIARENAWSRGRVRQEIAKCKEKGIKIIPMFNFSACHDAWLGEYHRKVSTPEYYRVCNDLIKEAYELFGHPEYINIAMDEEDHRHCEKTVLPTYRQGELFWHDLRFLIDCVVDTGAKPWMWADSLFWHPEEFRAHIRPDEVVVSPWYYLAFRREHWTPIESNAEFVSYYNQARYKDLGLTFVEEDPYMVNYRKVALPLLKEGYNYIPCTSVYNRCDWNTYDTYEYFKDNASDDQILGYVAAPWKAVIQENKQFFDETFAFFKEAKEKFYKEN